MDAFPNKYTFIRVLDNSDQNTFIRIYKNKPIQDSILLSEWIQIMEHIEPLLHVTYHLVSETDEPVEPIKKYQNNRYYCKPIRTFQSTRKNIWGRKKTVIIMNTGKYFYRIPFDDYYVKE